MKGTKKQIAWAENIKEDAIRAAGCIVRNAERNVELGFTGAFDPSFITVEAAKEVEQMVIKACETLDDAAYIIEHRNMMSQQWLEKMAAQIARKASAEKEGK